MSRIKTFNLYQKAVLVLMIAMVLVFKEQITTLVENIWKSINQSAKKIY